MENGSQWLERGGKSDRNLEKLKAKNNIKSDDLVYEE